MAPALKAWGRRWLIGEDDFALPALGSIAVHITLIILVCIGLSWGEGARCPEDKAAQVKGYLCVLLILDALLIIISAWLLNATTRGSILDVQLRPDVGWAVASAGWVFVLTLGIQIFGTYAWYTRGQCTPFEPTTSISSRAMFLVILYGHWATIAAVLFGVFLSWNSYQDFQNPAAWKSRCQCIALLICCSRTGRRRRDPTSNEPADMYKWSPIASLAEVFALFYGQVDLTISDLGTMLMLVGLEQRFTRIEGQSKQDDAVMLPGPDPTHPPSGIKAVIEMEPHTPPTPDEGYTRLAGSEEAAQQGVVPPQQAQQAEQGVMSASVREPVSDEALIESYEYFKYALSAYGWPMYVWTAARAAHVRGCCRMCSGCFPCCEQHPTVSGINNLNVSRGMTLEAYLALVGADPSTYLLQLNEDNQLAGLLPYQVSVVPGRKELVIAIRGSMSLYDVGTDLACEPLTLPPEWLNGKGALRDQIAKAAAVASGRVGTTDTEEAASSALDTPPAQLPPTERMAHRAMYYSARDVVDHLVSTGVLRAVLGGDTQALKQLTAKQRALLAKLGVGPVTSAATGTKPQIDITAAAVGTDSAPAAPVAPTVQSMQGVQGGQSGSHLSEMGSMRDQEWKLTVVGHSLGAGVAALLALHLRAALPKQQVKCWAYSPPGGLLSSSLSVDMCDWCTSVVIGRDMIPRLSAKCMDKLQHQMLSAGALCKVSKARLWMRTLFGKPWTRDELFRKPEEVPQEVWALVDRYSTGLHSSPLWTRFQPAFDFTPPGRVLYYECMRVDDEEPTGESEAGPGSSKPTADRAPTDKEPATPNEASTDAVVINLQATAGPVPGAIPVTSIRRSTTSKRSINPDSVVQPWGPQGAGGRSKAFVPTWTSAQVIEDGGLLVSKRMFAMHIPDFQASVMLECLPESHVP